MAPMLQGKAFISANKDRSKNKILEPVQVYTFQLEEGHIKQTTNTQSNSKRAEVCCEWSQKNGGRRGVTSPSKSCPQCLRTRYHSIAKVAGYSPWGRKESTRTEQLTLWQKWRTPFSIPTKRWSLPFLKQLHPLNDVYTCNKLNPTNI